MSIPKLYKKVVCVSVVWLLIYLLRLVELPREVVFGYTPPRYRSYGLAFTTMPPKKEKRVILLGNSAWEGFKTVRLLNELLRRTGTKVECANFSVASATIADDLIAYHYLKKFKPDLLLVQVHPMMLGWKYPFYRQESKKLIFSPEMKALRTPQIFKTYTNDELAQSVLYSHYALYRALPIARIHLKKAANSFFVKHFKFPLMNFFPYDLWPELADYGKEDAQLEFPHAEEFFRLFIDQLEQDRQKTVFILQETNSPQLPIIERLPGFFENKKYCVLHDFRGYYAKEEYIDAVHPNKAGSGKAALRLLKVIKKYMP